MFGMESLATRRIIPIRVKIKLKREQRERDGEFYMTLRGKKTKVHSPYVEVTIMDIEEIPKLFNINECLNFSINYNIE